MMQTVTVRLPEEIARRYQRGAAAAHKRVEEFIAERLEEAAPPTSDDLPVSLQEALERLEAMDDNALWDVARSSLLPQRQRLYSRLLDKNSQGMISDEERQTLTAVGDEARRLTLLKSHAFMLLKWRGHDLPPLETLQPVE